MESSAGILLFHPILIGVHVGEEFVVVLALLGLLFVTVPVASVIKVSLDTTVGAGWDWMVAAVLQGLVVQASLCFLFLSVLVIVVSALASAVSVAVLSVID